ncbi:MAG: hypothetical protein MHM6MM_001777 [Cercozoa sp. M6MM]
MMQRHFPRTHVETDRAETLLPRRCGIRIDNFLSERECQQLIEAAENNGGTRLLPLSQEYPQQYRSGKRFLTLAPEFVDVMWQRLSPLFDRTEKRGMVPFGHDKSTKWKPCGINPMLRITKYDPGDKFSPHRDSGFVAAPGIESAMTLLVYLNHDCKGGHTLFYNDRSISRVVPGKNIKLREVPKTGAALLFPHDVIHAGDTVESGNKYILRCDVLFEHQDGRKFSLRTVLTGASVKPKTGDNEALVKAIRLSTRLGREQLAVKANDDLDEVTSSVMHQLYAQSRRLVEEGDPEGSTEAFVAAVELRASLPSNKDVTDPVTDPVDDHVADPVTGHMTANGNTYQSVGQVSGDLLRHVAAFLGDTDVAAMACTCTQWHEALTSDASAFWRRKFASKYPTLFPLRAALFEHKRDTSPWHGNTPDTDDWCGAYGRQTAGARCKIELAFRRAKASLKSSVFGRCCFLDLGARSSVMGSLDFPIEHEQIRELLETAKPSADPSDGLYNHWSDVIPPYQEVQQMSSTSAERAAERRELLHRRVLETPLPLQLLHPLVSRSDLEKALKKKNCDSVLDLILENVSSEDVADATRNYHYYVPYNLWNSFDQLTSLKLMPSVVSLERGYSFGSPFHFASYGADISNVGTLRPLVHFNPPPEVELPQDSTPGLGRMHAESTALHSLLGQRLERITMVDVAQLQAKFAYTMRRRFGSRTPLTDLLGVGGGVMHDFDVQVAARAVQNNVMTRNSVPLLLVKPWSMGCVQLAQLLTHLMTTRSYAPGIFPFVAAVEAPVLTALASGRDSALVAHVSPSCAVVALVKGARLIAMTEWLPWREERRKMLVPQTAPGHDYDTLMGAVDNDLEEEDGHTYSSPTRRVLERRTRGRPKMLVPDSVDLTGFVDFVRQNLGMWNEISCDQPTVVVSGGVTLQDGFDDMLKAALPEAEVIAPARVRRLRATVVGARLFVSRPDAPSFFIGLEQLVQQVQFALQETPLRAVLQHQLHTQSKRWDLAHLNGYQQTVEIEDDVGLDNPFADIDKNISLWRRFLAFGSSVLSDADADVPARDDSHDDEKDGNQ